MRSFEDDGLIWLSARKLEVRMPGRMLVRNLAMVFDCYLGEQTLERFSRMV